MRSNTHDTLTVIAWSRASATNKRCPEDVGNILGLCFGPVCGGRGGSVPFGKDNDRLQRLPVPSSGVG